jgi:hypothetical protein
MEAVYNAFKPSFTTHHKKKNVEIEFRLGKINGNRFDPDVGKVSYTRMMNFLEKYKGWESIENSEYDVYNGPENFRTLIDDAKNTRTSMVKKKLINKNYKTEGLAFDVRMSIATETPKDETGDEVYEVIFHKKRRSFMRKGLRIDMTETTGDADDIDAENATSYQVELEIVDPSNTDEKSQFRNHVQKIGDVLKCFA